MKNSLFKYKRHLKTSLQHLTALKLLNILISTCEQKARRTRLYSKPYVARINTVSACNLRCVGCKGSERKHPNESSHLLTFEEYETILNKLYKHLLFVILYDEGEPFLNPSIIDIIRLTHKKNVGSIISTNFSIPFTSEFLFALAASGLSKLIVALDGMSQELYGKYRIGGNVDLVKHNLLLFCDLRKSLAKRPNLEIQYLDFGYNANEVEEAMQFALEIGAESFSRIKAQFYGHQKFDGKTEARRILGCSYLWSTIDINNDGNVYPCDYGEDHGMAPIGNMLHDPLRSLWNHGDLYNLRQRFQTETASLTFHCSQCPQSEAAPWIFR